MMRFLHGKVTPPDAFTYNENDKLLKELRTKEKLSILILGVLCLIFVPIFKTITHLPPFMGILMGVGMFIQIMTLTGVRGFIVTTCLSLPDGFLYVAMAITIPLFGAVSSYGSASVLGVPFLLAFLSKNQIITAAAISLIASLGDMMPPTALAGIFAAQVVGLDKYTKVPNEYPVFENIGACDVEADVIIDFSNAAAADELLDYCVEKQVPVVLCTTGLSEEQLAKVEESAKKVAVLKSANMSLGINLLLKILQDATKVLSPAGYDIELVEKHHNQKLDAPSGTALALADSINEAADNQYHYVYDRSQVRQKRDGKEIGISAVRGGTIVGDHEVLFAGQDEVIEFKHTAYSKAVFGKGAVEAAKFLAGKPAGRYDMSDVIQF